MKDYTVSNPLVETLLDLALAALIAGLLAVGALAYFDVLYI